jgi:hypothetical protein
MSNVIRQKKGRNYETGLPATNNYIHSVYRLSVGNIQGYTRGQSHACSEMHVKKVNFTYRDKDAK